MLTIPGIGRKVSWSSLPSGQIHQEQATVLHRVQKQLLPEYQDTVHHSESASRDALLTNQLTLGEVIVARIATVSNDQPDYRCTLTAASDTGTPL